MRVLLISPPIEDFFFTPVRAYPLGLLYIATVLQQAGIQVKILNAVVTKKKITIPVPKEFKYLARYYKPNKSAFCLFSHYYHFGETYEEIASQVAAFHPDIVGVSSNFSPYFDSARQVADTIKKVDTRIPVVLGGRFPTIEPGFVLSHSSIDFVIRGEAEFSFLELCRGLRENKIPSIPGMCFKRDGRPHIAKQAACIENLDELPLPDRTLLDYRSYQFNQRTSTALISSRGCPQACSFCAISERFRTRDPKRVIEEIQASLKLGITHFNFEDDNINLNPGFEKVLDFIIETHAGKLALSFMNGLMSKLPISLRKKLYSAGLTHLDLSLISSNPGLRSTLHRKEQPRELFAFSNALLKRSIVTTVHFIVAFPDQKFKDAIKDLHYLASRRVKLGPSIFYPVIEGKVFKILSEHFGITSQDRAFFRSSCAYFDKGISRDDIFLVLYLARMINFAKQLIDQTDMGGIKFKRYLECVVAKLDCRNNRCLSAKPLSREALGILVFYKILTEHTIYRVQESQAPVGFAYQMFKEEFVDSKKLMKSVRGLIIQGVRRDKLVTI